MVDEAVPGERLVERPGAAVRAFIKRQQAAATQRGERADEEGRARRRVADAEHEVRAGEVGHRVAAFHARPIDDVGYAIGLDDVAWMEVAVAEAVAVGEVVEPPDRERSQLLRNAVRRADPTGERFFEVRQVVRRDDFVQLGVQFARDTADAKDGPGLVAHQREQIGAVEAVHDQAGAAVHGRRTARQGYVHAGRVRRRERFRLEFDGALGVRLTHEAEDGTVLPGEDLGLAPFGDLQELWVFAHIVIDARRTCLVVTLGSSNGSGALLRAVRFFAALRMTVFPMFSAMPLLVALRAARVQRRVRSRETGDGHAERRAAHVVEPFVVEELDGAWLAAVLAADADL